MPYLCSRNQSENSVHHAEAGAENRDNGHFLALELFGRHMSDRGVDLDVLQLQVAHGFIALQHCNFPDKCTEISRSGLLAADDADLVLNQRMVHNHYFSHCVFLLRMYGMNRPESRAVTILP